MLFLISYMLVLSWADYSYVLPASAISETPPAKRVA